MVSYPPYESPVITILNDHEFELVKSFVFKWDDDGRLFRITIPKGFVFDGASVPRICWTLTGLLPTGIHLGAACIHDYLYQKRGRLNQREVCLRRLDKNTEVREEDKWLPVQGVWDRKQCDDMFLKVMKVAGETMWKAQTMYWAVRTFGAAAWDR